jgi:signal transduction histidine kinase
MNPSTPRRPPSFRGQAALILLPVALLTLAGFWALRQDRRLVGQDACERAAEALQTLATTMEQSLPFGLADRPLRVIATAEGPETPSPERPRFRCRWAADGRLLEPADYEDPPVPPQWWRDLTPEQRTGWDKLWQTTADERASSDPDEAFVTWRETNPPEPAEAAVRFFRLQAEARETGDTNHAPLIAFARAHPETTTPSGVPLIATAAATLLSHPEANPQRPLLLEALRACVVESPSTLTPLLLQRGLEACRQDTNAPMAELLALSRLWQAQNRLRQLAQALARQAPDRTEPHSVWLKVDDEEWLASFGPDHPALIADPTNRLDAAGTVACFLPRLAVEGALGHALDFQGDAGLPYAWLAVSVAGREMRLAGFPMAPEANVLDAPLLAETGLTIGRVAARETDPAEPAGSRRHSDDFLTLPAAVPVRLSLHLIHPELLFARQTQRAWLFGALIAAAAGTALLGIAGAYRAFHRQLRLAELKSNFVSSVSHELRAPIASVRLLAESLERGKIVEEPRRQDYFRLIGQECRRLSGLIDNVLDFSRIDQGRKRYEFEPTDLTALVGETVRLMEPYAAERRVGSDFPPPTESIELVADGRALQQALVNLLDNAIKHSPEGKSVRVELVATKDAIRLSVADSGPGIPAEDRERIFEPFFRRGSELRRETQGAGIGLSIVRHVVEAHQGRVAVHGPPDRGACFTLEIPIASEGHEH